MSIKNLLLLSLFLFIANPCLTIAEENDDHNNANYEESSEQSEQLAGTNENTDNNLREICKRELKRIFGSITEAHIKRCLEVVSQNPNIIPCIKKATTVSDLAGCYSREK
jgi:hypothetical protein